MSQPHILIIEDEEHIVELIKFNLESNGYKVSYAFNGRDGIKRVEMEKPDLVLLDLMLPEVDGIDVCNRIKNNRELKQIPIIMLTAKSSETDKIIGLEIGADDYMTKPFSIRELLTRIKVILRRYQNTQPFKETGKITVEDLTIDIDKHEVTRGETKFQLTLKEFELLKILAENRGKVLSRNFLLDEIWGYDYFGETRTVDVHIRHLRSKIESDSDLKYIETVRGVGYKVK